ncbi:hypothetical protein [Komagataeibacter sp. FNDCF1]|uniref:hypothetical protein n=1 Tax=Komagataeibacter sp. FNDCF1 TaxID=2878681 RepID=UPI001E4ED86F|nr:hypothetical protein [Komagataeibacter sp. FNDCF1]MCE2565213.1 hypothetical protein [Komagataeibacter sp. FNDCF1]
MTQEKEALQKIYKNVVEEELGSVAKIDDDGDVFFTVPDAGRFFIFLYENDPSYFRMGIFNFISRKDYGLPATELLEAVNSFNVQNKCCKFWLKESRDSGDHFISITIEAFLGGLGELPDEKILRATIGRYFGILNSGAHEIADHLRKRIKAQEALSGTESSEA